MGNVYRRKGTKNYFLAYYDENGKLVRRSAGTSNKERAEELLVEIESRILAKVAAGPVDETSAKADAEVPSLSDPFKLHRNTSVFTEAKG